MNSDELAERRWQMMQDPEMREFWILRRGTDGDDKGCGDWFGKTEAEALVAMLAASGYVVSVNDDGEIAVADETRREECGRTIADWRFEEAKRRSRISYQFRPEVLRTEHTCCRD